MKRTSFFSLIFSFLLFLGVSHFLVQPSFAQTTPSYVPTSQAALDNNLAPGVPHNLKTYTQSALIEVLSALTCQLAGYDPTAVDHKCLNSDPRTGQLSYTAPNSNLLSGVVFLVGQTTLPPVHFGDSVAYLQQNFHGATEHAYAANGAGFDSLSPLLGIWSAFRNVVYLLFILVFIIVGLAIMLRLKIDPRTVMSVQNQLPKIIINLILITFSFAIAGLLLDLMWVLIYLIINFMNQIDPKILPSTVTAHLFDNPIGFFNQIIDVKGTAAGVGRAFQQILQGILTPQTFGVANPSSTSSCDNSIGGLFCTLGNDIGGVVSALGDIGAHVEGIFGFLVSWIVGILGTVIITIAILIAMVRLWWSLLQSYVYILINTIIAPFTIFGGLLPGSKAGFGAWIKSMLSNILVFPTVIAVLLLGKAIMDALGNSGGAGLFLAPLIGTPSITGVAGAGGNEFGAIKDPLGMVIGFVILLITPKIADTVKQAIGAADFKAASGVFENLGAGQQFSSGVAGQATKPLTRERDTLTGKEEGAARTFARKFVPGFNKIAGYSQKPK